MAYCSLRNEMERNETKRNEMKIDVFSFVVHAEFEVGILQRIFISQTKDFHFANYRFSFRKLQIFISFRSISFRFVSFRSISFRKLQ